MSWAEVADFLVGYTGQVLLLSPHAERMAQGAGCCLQTGRGARNVYPIVPAVTRVGKFNPPPGLNPGLTQV